LKRVINGKLYDTETAESLHFWSNGRTLTDFSYRSKELFRTKKGAYFIHHVGGPMTDMAKPVDSNTRTGGEDIEPITEKEAIKFLEKHDGTDVLLELFPHAVEEA
jgi:hypothetical protein